MTENQEAGRVSDLLRQASSSARKARSRLERRRRPQRLPLSYGQQRLWFIDQMESGSPEYNMPEALRLRGKLNCEALRWTINMIVERHEVLRTHFLEVDGDPVQMIEPTLRISVPLEDLTGLGTEAKQEAVQEVMRREVQEPFNLSRGPLLRVRLLRLDMEDHILLRTVHHIVSDGWSQGVFNREFAMLYPAYGQSGAHLPEELPVQYADYALWQRTWLAEEMESGLAYWKKQLAGMPERLELPFDRMPQNRMLVAESYRATFTPEQMAGLKHLSTENRATPYMTMLAGFAVLLSRHSGQDDIVVGSPIANRQDPQLEGLIGCFVNSLVMRVRLKPEMSFRNLLAEVRTMALEAYQHQDLPFARLVEELAPKRSLNATPIFQVSFAQRNAPWEPQKLGGLEITPVGEAQVGAHYDLDVHAWFRGAGAEILWLYNRNVFDPWRIEQMAAQYVRILDAVMADAGSQLAALPLLSSDERRQILGRWNETVRAIAEETL
ncbi:MAG TPA: condensation domain-containing protein, partial [Candidatus Angelobacter sp.]|nr:condensation domain-containing protein [Candidatus Angelobacter sp.]